MAATSTSTPMLKIDGVVVNYLANSLHVSITRAPVNITTFGSSHAQYVLGPQRFEIEFVTADRGVGLKLEDAVYSSRYIDVEINLGSCINKVICQVNKLSQFPPSFSKHGSSFRVSLVGHSSAQTSSPRVAFDGLLEEAADMLKQLLEEAPEVYTDILLSLINDSDTECLILDPKKVAAAGRSSEKIKVSVVENKLVLTAETK